MILLLSTLWNGPAIGKEWTIQERQDQLMKDINKAQKAKALTDKEAKKLRGNLADVARRKKKMESKGKVKGKLDDNDKMKLESDLNDISVEIKKLQLEKRVESK